MPGHTPGIGGDSCKRDNIEKCEGKHGLCQEKVLEEVGTYPLLFLNQLVLELEAQSALPPVKPTKGPSGSTCTSLHVPGPTIFSQLEKMEDTAICGSLIS